MNYRGIHKVGHMHSTKWRRLGTVLVQYAQVGYSTEWGELDTQYCLLLNCRGMHQVGYSTEWGELGTQYCLLLNCRGMHQVGYSTEWR